MNRPLLLFVTVSLLALPGVVRADAAFDAVLAAELKLGKEQAHLTNDKIVLDNTWTKLVRKVVNHTGYGPSVRTYCESNARLSWCSQAPAEGPLHFELPKRDSLEYPLLEWCAADGVAVPPECKDLISTRDAYEAQLKKVSTATAERKEVLAKYAQSAAPAATLDDRIAGSRSARCATAYCFGGSDGTKYAFEPVVELPIGLTWATGNGALANHINASGLDVRLNAGIRFWMAYDLFSAAVLLFQPSLASSREVVVPGATQPFGSEAIRRPYPSLSLGFAGDIFMLTVSYDQLRNVRSNGNIDPNFLPDEVLSRSFTFGLYLAPLTAARNGIGAATAGARQ